MGQIGFKSIERLTILALIRTTTENQANNPIALVLIACNGVFSQHRVVASHVLKRSLCVCGCPVRKAVGVVSLACASNGGNQRCGPKSILETFAGMVGPIGQDVTARVTFSDLPFLEICHGRTPNKTSELTGSHSEQRFWASGWKAWIALLASPRFS